MAEQIGLNKLGLILSLCMILFLVSWILLGFGIYHSIGDEYTYKTTCTITSWQLSHIDRNGLATYTIHYTYLYDRNGQSYSGTLVRTQVLPPETGNTLTIYVSPKKPQKSRQSYSDKKKGKRLLAAWGACLCLSVVGFAVCRILS